MQPYRLFDSVEQPYAEISGAGLQREDALALVSLRDWFSHVVHFDPRSGQPLPRSISEVLVDVSRGGQGVDGFPKDRVARLLVHAGEALSQVLSNLRTRVQRDHEMVPIHAAKEFDSASISWLSRQSGRTVREKLGGKQSLMAVRRRMSVDTAENRLVAAFVGRLSELLRNRMSAFPLDASEARTLLTTMDHWSRDPVVSGIGRWTNLPPNNVLLQDKHYRKIWDAWLWMEAMGDAISLDHQRLLEDWVTVVFWKILARLDLKEGVRLLEQPCFFDYEQFGISPFLPYVEGRYFPDFTDGEVTWLGIDKGGSDYGWLKCANGKMVLFHAKDFLDAAAFDVTKTGDVLAFDLALGGKVPKAINIEPRHLGAEENGIPIQIIRNGQCSVSLHLGKQVLEIEAAAIDDPQMLISTRIGTTTEFCACTVDAADQIAVNAIDALLPRLRNASQKKTSLCVNEPDPYTVVDVSTVQPRFTNSKRDGIVPFLLAVQYWQAEDHLEVPVNLARSSAIALQSAQVSVSILDVIQGTESVSPRLLSQSARMFSEELAKYFGKTDLTYLVPDAADDFNLGYIRRSLNSCFRQAQPLPRSIAVLFGWLASTEHKTTTREGDCVLVIDRAGDTLCVTPITSFLNPSSELLTLLPESQGISWVKHPSFHMGFEGSAQFDAEQVLVSSGCLTPKPVARLTGLQGLSDFGGQLSIKLEDGKWFSPATTNTLASGQTAVKKLHQMLRKAVDSVQRRMTPGGVVHVLITGDPSFAKLSGAVEYSFDGRSTSRPWTFATPTVGGSIFVRWQRRAGNISLWNEHLPDLSIRVVDKKSQRPRRFYLVQEGTVTPRRGAAINIPIQDVFELPANETQCSFPLQQGEDGRELRFRAVLEHSTFPLKEPIRVRLQMTYTYGSDNPYDLLFVPVDVATAGFPYIRAQWLENVAGGQAEALSPEFPIALDWSALQSYPSNRGATPTNLLEWLERQINVLHRDFRPIDIQNYSDPEAVKFLVEKMRKGVRFPAINIWSHGRSIRDAMCPIAFRTMLQREFPAILQMHRRVSDALKLFPKRPDLENLADEFLFLICCTQGDAVPEAAETILSEFALAVESNKKLSACRRHFGYAIGNADLEWQRSILTGVLRKIAENPEKPSRLLYLELLSIALWRSEALVHSLTEAQMRPLLQCLIYGLNTIKLDEGNKRRMIVRTVTYLAELLLSLLRTRQSKDSAIAAILAPGGAQTKELMYRLDELTHQLFEAQIEIESRIKLNLDKPEILSKTPDLLFALDLYLSGHSGANGIRITAIDDASG